MKGEWFRLRVAGVVDIWEGWIVLGPGVTEDLTRRLSGGSKTSDSEEREQLEEQQRIAQEEALLAVPAKSSSSGFRTSSFQPAMLNAILPDADAVVVTREEQEVYNDELDGEMLVAETILGNDVDGEEIGIVSKVLTQTLTSNTREEEEQESPLDGSDDDIFA